MAGQVKFVVFMYCFSQMKAQAALLPPKLTVNTPVITETDSVTLNCDTPPSVSVSECYFRTVRGEPAKRFSCVHNVTGTELLKMANKNPPAEVELNCFYLDGRKSPVSDTCSIIIRTSLAPKLTVNPLVINETDSVTLNCETPSSVSQCYFFLLSGGRVPSCRQTMTGTEMLKIANQDSPAKMTVLKLMCFYTVKLGKEDSPSPNSDISSITIHTIESRTTQTSQTSQTFTITKGLTVTMPPATTATPTRRTTGWTFGVPSKTGHFVSTTFLTSMKPTSETDPGATPLNPQYGDKLTAKMWIWKFAAAVIGCGVTVGVILLVSAVLCNQRRAACSKDVRRREPENENKSDTYHVYYDINESDASALKDMVYSTVQTH